MKKIFFFAMAMLAYSPVPAHAKPLPSEYLGLWCFDTSLSKDAGEELFDKEECSTSEYLKFQRAGYELNTPDTYCKFISVKQIGKRYNAPRAEGLIGPEVIAIHTVARCTNSATEETWTEKRELVQWSFHLRNNVLSTNKATPKQGKN